MDSTCVPLDRPSLLAAVTEFLATAHDATVSPQAADSLPFRAGELPPALRDPPRGPEERGGVLLRGAEARQYNSLRQRLSSLRETEWLKGDDLDEQLWTLACQVAIAPTEFATPAVRQVKAEAFLEGVLRPLRRYEVLVTIDHIQPLPTAVAVWDAHLVTATRGLLDPFVGRVEVERQQSLREPFLGKTIIRLDVEATAVAPAIERGRAMAHHRLHLLRTGLATHWQTAPEQLWFELGDVACGRALSGEPEEWFVWQRSPAMAVELQLHAGHTERLDELQRLHNNLGLAHPSLRPVIERAGEWIGRGVCRHWLGDALRDYTTAMEVLLVVAEAEQKSVLVPYRMLALADLHGEPMTHPLAIRHAYDRRSVVVHQGEVTQADEDATRRMLGAARDCARWLARYGADHPDCDHASLMTSLDTPELRRVATTWLAKFPSPWTQKLLRGIESLPANH